MRVCVTGVGRTPLAESGSLGSLGLSSSAPAPRVAVSSSACSAHSPALLPVLFKHFAITRPNLRKTPVPVRSLDVTVSRPRPSSSSFLPVLPVLVARPLPVPVLAGPSLSFSSLHYGRSTLFAGLAVLVLLLLSSSPFTVRLLPSYAQNAAPPAGPLCKTRPSLASHSSEPQRTQDKLHRQKARRLRPEVYTH